MDICFGATVALFIRHLARLSSSPTLDRTGAPPNLIENPEGGWMCQHLILLEHLAGCCGAICARALQSRFGEWQTTGKQLVGIQLRLRAPSSGPKTTWVSRCHKVVFGPPLMGPSARVRSRPRAVDRAYDTEDTRQFRPRRCRFAAAVPHLKTSATRIDEHLSFGIHPRIQCSPSLSWRSPVVLPNVYRWCSISAALT